MYKRLEPTRLEPTRLEPTRLVPTRLEKRSWFVNIIVIITLLLTTIVVIYLYLIFGISFKKSIVKSVDKSNENWMSSLDPENYITQIVLPGTHDSLAFGEAKITNTKISKLAKSLFKYKWIPGLKHKITRWAETQQNDITAQLNRGIRYFDFRVVFDDIEKKCYGIHTCAFAEFSDALDKIESWISQKPTEVIIIKYRSSSVMCDNIFRKKLVKWILPAKYDIFKMKLKDFYSSSYRIILSADVELSSKKNDDLIHPNIFFEDWKNTFSEEEKKEHMINTLTSFNSNKNKLFILDWTITPQTTDVILNNSSLLKHAENMNGELDFFLKNLNQEDKNKIKIISVDNEKTIDLVNIIFSNNLNKKQG